jgi:hypothetical protein
MKIRIQRNSIRMRLSKTEVERLCSEDYIEERTSFGKQFFSYAVKKSNSHNELSADFTDGRVTLSVPEKLLVNWPTNDVVGFDANMPTTQNETLYLLLEKDFKCLDNTAEDQSDHYDNPNQTC